MYIKGDTKMETEHKMELGTRLISIAITPKWKQRKKVLGVSWRRVIEIGLETLETSNESELTKLLKMNRALEAHLQEANRRADEYQQLLSCRR